MSSFIEPDWPAPSNVVAMATTRIGGGSAQPYDSFNLGHHVGDAAEAVTANRNQLENKAGVERCNWLNQVHGSTVVEAGEASIEEPYPEADALWSRQPGEGCVVLSADCLPVLFCTKQGDVVAAAHAGWRGLLGGVLEATVVAMTASPDDILAWLGPAIGPTAFEVGPEVQEAFLAHGTNAEQPVIANCFVPNEKNVGYSFANLYALARLRLASGGVTQIFGGTQCTFGDSAKFYSYRRDGNTGRMASLISIRNAPDA